MSTENLKSPPYSKTRNIGTTDDWTIKRKFFKPLIPSSRYSRIPYLNDPVINVGDWTRKGNSLQPRRRTLMFEDRPFTYRQLALRANQLCPLLLARGYTSGTTGLPKRAILSRRRTFSNALNADLFYNLTSRDPRRTNHSEYPSLEEGKRPSPLPSPVKGEGDFEHSGLEFVLPACTKAGMSIFGFRI